MTTVFTCFNSKRLQLVLSTLALCLSPVVSKADHFSFTYTFQTGEVGYGNFEADKGGKYFENIKNIGFDFTMSDGQSGGFPGNRGDYASRIPIDGSTDDLFVFIEHDFWLFPDYFKIISGNVSFRGNSFALFDSYDGPETWWLYPPGDWQTEIFSERAPIQYRRSEKVGGWHLNGVPDTGSTVALLGAAFIGLAALRRRFTA